MSTRTLILVFVVMCVSLLALILISSMSVQARTITVDDSGGRDYTTIQAAVNAAASGDTIYVYNGTYSTITLKSGITILGESNESTVIHGSGASGSTGVDVDASGYTTYATVKNIKIDNFFYGVHVWGHGGSSTHNSFTSNTITNCDYGVYIDNCPSNEIKLNRFSNCDSYGVLIYLSASSSNSITDNTISNSGTAVSINSCSSNTVTTNVITNCFEGINLTSSSNNNIADNKILSSWSYDFSFVSSSTVSTNNSFDTTKVYCGSGSSMTVKTYLGIVVSNSDSTHIQNAYAAVKVSGTAIYTGYTDANGNISNILVTVGAYSGSSTFSKNTVIVNVSYGNLLFSKNNRSVDMSLSHIEYFTVNRAPVAYIAAPLEDEVLEQNTPAPFEGYGTDYEDIFVSKISWYSSVNGYLGDGNISIDNLSVGAHKITLVAMDADGSSSNASVNITVVPFNFKPVAHITVPTGGQTFLEGASINFTGYGTDHEDGFLTGTSISWWSDINGLLGRGNLTLNNLTGGSHTITLTVSDTLGKTNSTIVNITINSRPVAYITTPTEGQAIIEGMQASFTGYGKDVEDGFLTGASIRWSSNVSGALGTGNVTSSNLPLAPHIISLTVTDSSGQVASTTVNITISSVKIKNNNTGVGYYTIQDAVNSASSGDTIFVRSGTYYEQITISKSITLVGENNQDTIIRGNGGTASKGIYITANHVTLRNVKLENFGYAVYISSGSNNTITGNTIANNRVGVSVYDSSNNAITFNTITSSSYAGIQLLYSSNNNITTNDLSDNKPYGVYLGSGIGNTAINNWWGSASGPYHQTINPSGKGDSIADGVPFSPWATSPFNLLIPKFSLHEWGIFQQRYDSDVINVLTAPSQKPMYVEKPVIYFHSNETKAFDINVSVELDGDITKTIPSATVVGNKMYWNVTVLPNNTVSQNQVYDYLFYEGQISSSQNIIANITYIDNTTLNFSVKNIGDYAIYDLFFVYGYSSDNESDYLHRKIEFVHINMLNASEEKSAILNLSNNATYNDQFNETRRQTIAAVTNMGLTSDESQEMVDYWQDAWFAPINYGIYANIIYFIPQDEYNRTLPITVTPSPDCVVRVGAFFVTLINHAPKMGSVTANDMTVNTGGRTTINVVNAFDPDCDVLTYTYTATGGAISGTGPKVTWTAPATNGTYSITVTVSDGEFTVADSVNIAVITWVPQPVINHAPVITSITVNTTVSAGEQVTINVVANDTDGDNITYSYMVTGGARTGDGPSIIWTAPATNGAHKITVTVSDGNLTAIEFINITVVGGATIVNPPTVTITSGFEATVIGVITITGTASGDILLEDVRLRIDSSSWIAVNGTDSWSYSLDTTSLTNGKHTIIVKAYDGTQYSAEKTVEIDVKNVEETAELKKESKGFVPGFEFVAIIAGLGILLLLMKRRRV